EATADNAWGRYSPYRWLPPRVGRITATRLLATSARVSADNAWGVIRIWTPPGLPVFVLISNLCTTASVYPASWSGVATPEP
ncbi:hypothetical protein OFB92_34600, partial [Escherichia coli]|nr:hypothetical protein [Escherichia coli]